MKFTTFATAGSLLVLALAARAQEDTTATDATGVTDTQTETVIPTTVTDVTDSASDATGLPTDLSSVISSASSAIESITNNIPPVSSGTGVGAGPSNTALTNPPGSSPAPPRTTSNSGGRSQTQTQSAASQTPSNAASPLNVGRLTAGLGAGIVVAALL